MPVLKAFLKPRILSFLCDFLDTPKRYPGIPYLSARSTWEPKGLSLPIEWKVRSFSAEIEKFYLAQEGEKDTAKDGEQDAAEAGGGGNGPAGGAGLACPSSLEPWLPPRFGGGGGVGTCLAGVWFQPAPAF